LTGLSEIQLVVTIVGTVAASVVLVLPGWVFVSVLNRGIRESPAGERQMLLETTFAGVLVHLIALPWTIRLAGEVVTAPLDHTAELAAWVAVVFIALPAALGLLLAGVASWSERAQRPGLQSLLANLGLASSSRIDSAWTWAFRRQWRSVFIKVHLRDGTVLGGRFGELSRVPVDPERRDLYLESLWHLDARGWFDQPYPNSRGAWISGADIAMIEFHEEVPEHG
jgi:hypothetical protein